jgi:hypothetical protein
MLPKFLLVQCKPAEDSRIATGDAIEDRDCKRL